MGHKSQLFERNSTAQCMYMYRAETQQTCSVLLGFVQLCTDLATIRLCSGYPHWKTGSDPVPRRCETCFYKQKCQMSALIY